MSNRMYGENKYGKYCFPVLEKQRRECTTIMNGDVWEPDTTDLILEKCKHDLIHGGTFFGDMLPAFKNLEKVWAFEPCTEHYECTLETIKLNNITNVSLTHAAVGEKIGKARFKAKDDKGRATGSAGRIISGGRPNQVDVVNMVTIDSIIPKNRIISVIHLDVESYEVQALRGAMSTIQRCWPLLILESKPRQIGRQRNFLSKLGYKEIGRTHFLPEVPEGVNTVWEKKK